MKAYRKRATRVALLAASSLYGLAAAAPASAQLAPPGMTVTNDPGIIINNTLNSTTPPPTGSLDTTNILMPDGTFSNGLTIGAATGVNGVGQMTIATNPATTALLLCTGTLIDPRTVIFAAHCVNEQPASSYGVNGTAFGPWANGTPMAFGFGTNNLPALPTC